MRMGIAAAAACACSLLLVGHAPAPPTLNPGETAAPAPAVDPIAAVEGLRHEIVPNGTGLQVGDARYRAEFGADGFTLAHRSGPSSFGLQTEQINGVPAQQAKWRADGNRAERDVAPGIVERVTAREGRLEWDFVLAHAPAIAGDLRIEATVEARGPPGRTGNEWRWPAGKRRSVTMGELVVVDATGRELYRALPDVRGYELALRVPASVLADASYPLTIDPVVSPEYAVADPRAGTNSAAQEAPAVAFDGTNYLVVWSDWRNGQDADIYGARVSTSGTVLDAFALPISTAAEDQRHPAVSFSGTNYLVVWEDNRVFDDDIYGARVSTAGDVLDAAGIPISTRAGWQFNPAVAWNGEDSFLVVWEDWGSDEIQEPDIYGRRVSASGTPLSPSTIQISIAVDNQRFPQLAFDGTNFLVVWDDLRGEGYQVWGARVSKTGVVQETNGIKLSGTDHARTPVVSFGGGTYLVAWRAEDEDTGEQIRGSLVSVAGVVNPASISISQVLGEALAPAVASNGTEFLVAWGEGDADDVVDLVGARVTAAGAVLDPSGLPLAADIGLAFDLNDPPTLLFASGGYLLAWADEESFDSDFDIRGVLLSAAGVPAGANFLISRSVAAQTDAAVAFDGTNYLVVWVDQSQGDIYASRVTPDGTKLDGTGFAVSSASYVDTNPTVSFNGTDYFVAWEDRRNDGDLDIYGARVTTAGSVLDPAGVAISTASGSQANPAVAQSGSEFVVVWDDTRSDLTTDVYGARVSSAGTVLDAAGIPISIGDGEQVQPRIAAGATNLLVTWDDDRQSGSGDIFGTRLSAAGAVLDSTGIPISTSGFSQRSSSVAFDGTNFLVVWEDYRSDATADVYGARVSSAGAVLEATGIPISAELLDEEMAPTVAFDGTNQVVVWIDDRAGFELLDIYAARVSPAGTVHDPFGFAVAASSSRETQPDAVRGVAGSVGVAYRRLAAEAPFGGVDRAALRVLTTLPTIPTQPVIDSGPSGLFNSTSADFVFSGGGTGVSFECSRDGAPFTPCVSPSSYTGLGQGAHTFQVRAKDADNLSSAAESAWTVDSIAPPTPVLESGPSGATASTSATFAFSDTEAGVALECNLDAGAFVSCVSPVSHSDLSQGSHTFRVRAKDAAGNTSSVLSRTWTVDTVAPPVPTITAGPNGLVNISSANFAYTSEANATFECRRDALAFAVCNATKNYGLVEEGPHTFEVRAKDVAGNFSDYALRSWTVDTVKPPLPIVESGPNNVVVGATSATFTFSNTEPGVRFECSLDHAGTTICTSPLTYTNLSEGAHHWFIRARDAALNVTFNVERDWTVDSLPPPVPTIDSGPSGPVASTAATFTFSTTESGASFDCKLDSGSFVACAGSANFVSLVQGSHTFVVRSRDAIGNVSAEASRTWTADTLPPPVPNFDVAPLGTVTSTSASFTFSDTEAGVAFECRLDLTPFATCTSPVNVAGLGQGAHAFEVRAKDALGNTSLASRRAWSVDTVAPPTTIGTKPKAKTTARTAKFTFKSEKGAKFECKLDKAAFKACKSGVTYKRLKVGKHTLQVRAKDLAGNLDKTPAKFSWRVT